MEPAQMTFSHFSLVNKVRCESPHGFNHSLESWSLSDWITAITGELGEAANIVKKLNRIRDKIPGNGELTEQQLLAELQDELADTFIYLDLMFSRIGVDITDAIRTKYNKTSKKINSPFVL